MLKPTLDVHPHHARMPRAQARSFELIGFINDAVTVEQNGEVTADFLHPLLDGGKRSERNDEDASVESLKFFLVRAQLCGMFAAGYSAKMTEEDEQNMIAVFQNFVKCDLFTVNGREGEVGCGGVEFHVSSVRLNFALPR